jgi:ribonucleoside-triphosphate reductase
MNEACVNFLGCSIAEKEGKEFAENVLDFMRSVIIKYQEETGNLYNLEATPAEGTSYRLAQIDKALIPDIVTSGSANAPYYTNSSQLPVGYSDDLFEVLDHQDTLQTKYTGGTVLHGFIGEEINDPNTVKNLIKNIFTNYRLPYLTITPTFSICPTHGYIAGEHFTCPKCVIEQKCEVYSRVVGYLRPIQNWHVGKQEEFKQRVEFK